MCVGSRQEGTLVCADARQVLVPGCIDLSGCFKVLNQLPTGAKLLYFITGLRFSRVLRPPCLGVIHEIIHSLALPNYFPYQLSLVLQACHYVRLEALLSAWMTGAGHAGFPGGNVFASEAASGDGWVHLESGCRLEMLLPLLSK